MNISAGTTGRPRFLASVTSVAEALTARAAGAEIIDCKNPAQGALGALPHDVVRAIVDAIEGAVPVSATIGDLPPDPEAVCTATAAMAANGADFVKIGFFNGGNPHATIAALGTLDLGTTKLVGLLLADRQPDFNLVPLMRAAGFAGVMLDTASKDGRALTGVMARTDIANFVALSRSAGLFAGLAGALRVEHIPSLAALNPDLLGFRGALCSGKRREGPLEGEAARAVAEALGQMDRRLAAHAILEATP